MTKTETKRMNKLEHQVLMLNRRQAELIRCLNTSSDEIERLRKELKTWTEIDA